MIVATDRNNKMKTGSEGITPKSSIYSLKLTV